MTTYQCAICNRNYELQELRGHSRERSPVGGYYLFCNTGKLCGNGDLTDDLSYMMYDENGRLCAVEYDTGRTVMADVVMLSVNGRNGKIRPFRPNQIPFATWR